ncbi:MAG: TolC family protein [Gemmatimonadetes bacterium]|nr:TolC family protein [Gemmatimonadota bacterium]NIS01962.1 TolC family protein [Gemmatimonadota bacterium]NIT67766.1 TolC family protein [Gemmatimonadota bacterium]NIV24452.1 TolC family protein [Gemmatimonadota bacterium]NIW76366.1 TolC family protein [Gemmatimonadota bacterium]
MARARETYPSLAAARAGEEASAAAVGEATADRWPELRAQANLTRFQEPMLVAPLHGFDISTPPEFDQTLIRGDVSFAWTVYDGGARGARIRAARAEAVGAGATRQAADMALITRTARVYLEILATHGVLEAQDRRIAALEAEGSRVRQFLEQGRAAAVELLRVQAALADARAGRVATATRLDLAERQLGRLIDVPVDSVRASRLVSLSLAPAADLEDRAELVARAQAASPELERSRQAVIAAEAARRAAIAAWIPKLSLFGGYLGFSGFGGDLTAEWQAGIGVSYPLFTGGGRSAATRTAEARARRAREELQLAELEIADRVDAALNAALETRARVEAVAEGVQHQSEVVRIELLSLEAGAGTQTDYLRAEADLMRVRSALVEARHAEIAARVELARALGELTPEWLAENLENVR